MTRLEDLDLNDFWDSSAYARDHYVDVDVTDELVASVEQELGVRLPAAYIALMRHQNGGIPTRDIFLTDPDSDSPDEQVAITDIMGIGRAKKHSLLGELGSPFMQREWGYPTWGVCICNCPSAGHDMIMLDYRECGPVGEPTVVHVDQEAGYRVTFLAPNFATFIRGLVDESYFYEDEAELDAAYARADEGKLSEAMTALLANAPGVEAQMRRLFRALVSEKGHVATHADELSYALYDLVFDLYSSAKVVRDGRAFIDGYVELTALGGGTTERTGYAEFVEDWFEARVGAGAITRQDGVLTLSVEQRRQMQSVIDRV